jgi:hypothetical protein
MVGKPIAAAAAALIFRKSLREFNIVLLAAG